MNEELWLIPIALIICGLISFAAALLFWWLEKNE